MKQEEAEAALKAADEELAEVESALAAAAASPASAAAPASHPEGSVLHDVRRLLEALEQAPLPAKPGQGPILPDEALNAMRALRMQLDAPPPPARLDEPLESVALTVTESDADSGQLSEDDLMGELCDIDEGNSEALAEVARRLKGARRMAPY